MNKKLIIKWLCTIACSTTLLMACNGSGSSSNSNNSTSSNYTGNLYCQYISLPIYLNESVSYSSTTYQPIPGGVYSEASDNCTSIERNITGNGIPNHSTGIFPNSGDPNSITIQNVSFITTLTPTKASSPTYLPVANPFGYLNNGIKLDPISAETVESNGKTWNVEALGQDVVDFGIDYSNGHVQPGGNYHYHGLPIGYLEALNEESSIALIGFAIDGFPIYSNLGYSDPNDSSSAVVNITSSWQLKSTPDEGRPSTVTYPMGTFAQDYEYIAGSGDLDECNGRFSITPQFPNGIYQYYITETFPFIQRCIYGVD